MLAEALGIGGIQTPLPLHFTWADNYESLVDGYSLPWAVNVVLQKGPLVAVIDNPLGILPDAHSYPIDWYKMSILTPADANNPLGFKRSYEYAPSGFPPTAFQAGSIYHQSPWNYDELALEPMPLIEQPFGALGDNVVQTTVDTVQYTGGVVVNAADSTWNAATGLFNYVWNAAAQGGQTLINQFQLGKFVGRFPDHRPLHGDSTIESELCAPDGRPFPCRRWQHRFKHARDGLAADSIPGSRAGDDV